MSRLYEFQLLKLICALFGHKWRDTSYKEFKRENGKNYERTIKQEKCSRCGEETWAHVGEWREEQP